MACYEKSMNQRGFWKLAELSDERLVGSLKELLVADARTEVRIVAHLAELDARRCTSNKGSPCFNIARSDWGSVIIRLITGSPQRESPGSFRWFSGCSSDERST